jgi:hypothetical protein
MEPLKERQAVHTSSSKVYERKHAGQGDSLDPAGSLNGGSDAGYPENIPSQIVRSASWQCQPAQGWMHLGAANAGPCVAAQCWRVFPGKARPTEASARLTKKIEQRDPTIKELHGRTARRALAE